MEFLVFCEVRLGPTMAEHERAELLAAESVRAGQLAAAGKLKRLWRVPGRTANRGLWEATDATDLHDALTSLPLFPWMDIHVEALAVHPNDPSGSRPR